MILSNHRSSNKFNIVQSLFFTDCLQCQRRVSNKLWKSRILKEAEDIKTLLEKYYITCVQLDDKRWYWVRVMVFNGTINNISAISWLSVLLMLKFVVYYCFLFMWYNGIVPILYLDDGRDYRLSPVELILYMWQILWHEDKIYVMNNFQDKSSLFNTK